MKIFSYKDSYEGSYHKVGFAFVNVHGKVAITLINENGLPFGLLTANLGTTNGFIFPLTSMEFISWLEEIGAGNYLGVDELRGFNTYPLFKFDKEFLREANPEQFNMFFKGVE